MAFDPSKIIVMANAWDTLKNDDYDDTGSVTVPSSVVIAGAGVYSTSTDIYVGSAKAMANIRVQSSKGATVDYTAGGTFSVANTAGVSGFLRTGSLGSYNIYPIAYWVGGTNIVRIEVFVPNPYGISMTGASGAETFTFKIRTFKAPIS